MYWAGLLLCALLGVELGGIAAGIADSHVPLIVISSNLAPWTAIGGFTLLAGGRRRRVEAALGPVRLETAMARIESSRAVGEGPDIPLQLDLTVAPTGRPAYRANATAVVNLMDLDEFRVGRTVVVDHDPERPWNVRVRRQPGAEFAGRVALAKIDTAPVETRRNAPSLADRKGGRPSGVTTGLLAVLAGALLSPVPFHGLWS
ncbi:hypothetical protein BX265_8562 [Streptomyces sp. TLI_235]|nr:hypothetical protein [Streptomyces sp. TLI_235]PBC66118.1 hypothetical protein BX265_8562 [Streptomyces sp. TLI_235]